MKFTDRLLHSWNAFRTAGSTYPDVGVGSSAPSGKNLLSRVSADSLAGTIYNRIAIDSSMVTFHHVKTDKETGNETDIESKLNNIFNLEANIDQNSVDFIQDIVYSMFDEGVVAVVPVHTTLNPKLSGSYDILSMRVGKVTQWYPKHVKVMLYNEETGRKQEVVMDKKFVALIENPLYPVVPLGELKNLARARLLIFDEEIMKWTMGNSIAIEDNNGNYKLSKMRNDEKIDNVSALLDAWVIYKRYQEAFE